MDQTEQLQSKVQEILAGITPEDHSSWLAHPCSKLLETALKLDLHNLQMSWSLGHFDEAENLKAQGQAFYILGLQDDLRHMLEDQVKE
jgi:hypothetical protein